MLRFVRNCSSSLHGHYAQQMITNRLKGKAILQNGFIREKNHRLKQLFENPSFVLKGSACYATKVEEGSALSKVPEEEKQKPSLSVIKKLIQIAKPESKLLGIGLGCLAVR